MQINIDRLIDTDGRCRSEMAKGCGRSEFRLHVQIAHNWKQFRWQDVVSVPVRRWQFHVRVRQHCGHRFQSENSLQTRQTRQTTNMGERDCVWSFCRAFVVVIVWGGALIIIRIRQDRNGTGQSQLPITEARWDLSWCTISLTRSPSTACKIGKWSKIIVFELKAQEKKS